MNIKKFTFELYKMDAAGTQGVLMRKDVMRKVCKLQAAYIQQLKELLNEEVDNLIAYQWTMGWDKERGGEAIYANYVDGHQSVENRIGYFGIVQPIKVDCYDSTDRQEVNDLVATQYLEQFETADKESRSDTNDY